MHLVLRVAAVGMVVGALCAVQTAFADERRSELVLSNLPSRGSPQYLALRDLAADPVIEVLGMTKGEVWTVPTSRVADVARDAARAGLAVTRLDENWNRMLTPYSAAPPLTKEQETLVRKTMESKAAVGGSMMALPAAAVFEYALTKGMGSISPDATPSLLFSPLNERTTVTARRTRLEQAADCYIWHGVTVDTQEPVTLIWWPSGRLTGSITYRGRMFAVKPMGERMQGVVEMSPKMMPREHQPMSSDLKRQTNTHDDRFVKRGDAGLALGGTPNNRQLDRLKDATRSEQARGAGLSAQVPPDPDLGNKPGDITITLIVAYTEEAARHYNDIEKDLIPLAVEEANQSFRNSGIENVRLKVVHAYKTDYVENGTHFDHLYRFVNINDGYMDEIGGLRADYGANIALLIVHDPHGCGLSAQVAATPDKAFAVVHHECAALTYSLAHEIGHILGARHELTIDDSTVPFPFGHGFVDSRNNWRDIMSYDESCGGCPRIPLWSNPDIMINGVAVGDDKRNNARVIRERAPVVAGFR